jgi:hypothetical protein
MGEAKLSDLGIVGYTNGFLRHDGEEVRVIDVLNVAKADIRSV